MARNRTQRNDNPEKLTLTAKESLRISGLSRQATYRLIREGVLPALWNGKGWIIPKTSLQEFIVRRAAEESAQKAHRLRAEQRKQKTLPAA